MDRTVRSLDCMLHTNLTRGIGGGPVKLNVNTRESISITLEKKQAVFSDCLFE